MTIVTNWWHKIVGGWENLSASINCCVGGEYWYFYNVAGKVQGCKVRQTNKKNVDPKYHHTLSLMTQPTGRAMGVQR